MHGDLHRELQNALHEARLRAAAERRAAPPAPVRERRRGEPLSRLAAAVVRRARTIAARATP
jgi:hypothetical protein